MATLERTFIGVVVVASLVVPASGSDREQDVARIRYSAQVFREIMTTPDKAVPQELLESVKCVAIIPGEETAAFFFGERYSKGVAVCRTTHGWSAPLFLAVGGGSFGFQVGGSSTDVVMLFMNERALQSLLNDKFKIGADVSVAAGRSGGTWRLERT